MDGESPPKGPLESLYILLACPRVLLRGRCWTVPPSSSHFPGGLQSLLTALAHRLEGASRSLGRGRGVCPAHGRRTVKQELVARTNHARLVSSSKQSVQPTGHTVTPGSSQGSTDQEKEQKVNREKDWGQNMPPQTNQEQHCIASWVPDQFPKALTVLLRAPTPTPITRGLRCQAFEFLRLRDKS